MEQPDVMDVVDFEEDDGAAVVGGVSPRMGGVSGLQDDDVAGDGDGDGGQANNGSAADAADGGGGDEDADVAQGDRDADADAAEESKKEDAVAARYEYPTGPIKIDQL